MEENNARCVCTLEDRGDGSWVKPMDGYLEPDPKCELCGGTGEIPIHFPKESECEAVWVAYCAKCGDEIPSIHFQLKGEPPPDNEEYKPCCLKEDCDGEGVWRKVNT